MTKGSLGKRIKSIQVFKKGALRAPHKPLYLLLLLSSLQKGKQRLICFREVNDLLSDALRRYAPYAKSLHPEYPFWRLQNDCLSVVESNGGLIQRRGNTDPTKQSLIKSAACGGFLASDYEDLLKNPSLQSELIHLILDLNFPPSLHEDLLAFFGLRIQGPHYNDRMSNSEFASIVCDAYSNECCISGISGSYISMPTILTGAHICWPQAGGTDSPENGLCLSSIHQKLFHLGAFSIDLKFNVLISRFLLISQKSCQKLGLESGKKIKLPAKKVLWPSQDSLEWHRKWVYKQ
jgi:putative restriction endonuclease